MFRLRYSLLFFIVPFAFALEKGEVLYLPPEQDNSIVRKSPMPEMVASGLGKVLDQYYEDALGGEENWKRIESLSVVGRLKLKGKDFDVLAYQKKPNLIKISMQEDSGASVVLSYDGNEAWQQIGSHSAPILMGEKEARRFIHSGHFGNHLLFPFAEGKTITYVDTVPVEGNICHQIRVELDTGYQVDYYIDIRSFLEVKVENTDLINNTRNSVIYSDYSFESGLPIAMKVESLEEGEWVSTMEIDEIKVNSGVMPWMFDMPH